MAQINDFLQSPAAQEYHFVLSVLKGLRNGAFYGTKIRLPHALVMTFLFRQGSLHGKLRKIVFLTYQHTKNLALFVAIYKLSLNLLRAFHISLYLPALRALARVGKEPRGELAGRLARALLAMLLPNASSRGASACGSPDACGSRAGLWPTVPPPGRPAVPLHAFVAGAVGSYFVWSKYTSVNYQIIMYLLSRVIIALFRYLAAGGTRVASASSASATSAGATAAAAAAATTSTTTACTRGATGLYPFSKFTFRRVYPYLAVGVWGLVMWEFEHCPELLHRSLATTMEYLYHDSNHWKHGLREFLPSAANVAILAAAWAGFQ